MQFQSIQDALQALKSTRTQADRDSQKVNVSDSDHLKQLIIALRSLQGSLPLELQSLVSGLISEAEEALAAGEPFSIGRLINKIEEALALLQEILQMLAKGESEAATAAIQIFIARMLGNKRIKDKIIRQQEASMEASLAAMMNMQFGEL